jgi:hypothetical protein
MLDQVWPKGHNLYNFCKGTQGRATGMLSNLFRLLAFNERNFRFHFYVLFKDFVNHPLDMLPAF